MSALFARGLMVTIAAVAGARVALAEEEVRIAVASGKSDVAIEGADLALYDADVGDRLAQGAGKYKVTVRGAEVEVSGPGSVVHARRVFFEAETGVRVDGRLFLGRISAEPDETGRRLMVINRLPIETYLLGIVGSEMSPAWHAEALKAQAVAARTYAMQRRMMMRAANRPYDLESTVLSQVYLGAEKIEPSVIAAVSATRGEVLSWKHTLVEALFHSTCGGRTASARSVFGRSLPYLESRRCRWCTPSKHYRWQANLSLGEVEKKLRSAKLVSGPVARVERSEKDDRVEVESKGKKIELTPKAVRAAVGFGTLYSTDFVAKTRGRTVSLSGAGFGHGVGMCQWGARGLAEDGHNYREILGHYYQGSEVKRIY